MINIPIPVREALRAGTYKKNYRFVVYTADGTAEDFTIDNSMLVSEQVQFNEHMASSQTLKFGLCEGTSLQFQYFNAVNITGRRLMAYIDVQYKDTDGLLKWYAVPMGWFTVQSCARNSKTGVIKATAYNKLMSDYLDADAKDAVSEIVTAGEDGVTGEASVRHILDTMLEGYSIEPEVISEASFTYNVELVNVGGNGSSGTVPSQNYKYMHWTYATIQLLITDSTVNDYYAFKVFCKNIRDKIKTWCPYLDTEVMDASARTYTCEEIIDSGWYSSGTVKRYIEHLRIISQTKGLTIYNIDLTGDDEKELPYTTYLSNYIHAPIYLTVPVYWFMDTTEDYETVTSAQETIAKSRATELINSVQCIEIYKKILSNLEKLKITTDEISAITNGLTLRDLQSAVFEQLGQFGKLDRETDLFSGVYLNNTRLLPGDDVEPSETLYPASTAENSNPAVYTDLFADEGDVHNFRYLIITYKGTDGQEHTLQRTVNTDGTDNYNMSSNWIFKNLEWTAAQVGTYADAMVPLIKDVQWFPFEMDLNGLPYVEAGDEIEITINKKTYTTYVLQRMLQGIQRLQDTFYNGTVNTF